MAIFNKKNNKKKADNKDEKEFEVQHEAAETAESLSDKILPGSADAYKIIKHIYMSEKASMMATFNQYVFKVFPNATKSEIKKKIEKLFNVKVKDVKVLNMPRKRKDIGRHPGFRSGFKKAIVVLEKGHTIEQAKV